MMSMLDELDLEDLGKELEKRFEVDHDAEDVVEYLKDKKQVYDAEVERHIEEEVPATSLRDQKIYDAIREVV